MAQTNKPSKKRKLEQYAHTGKTRLNNPPAGLVTAHTEPSQDAPQTYQYDPHIDPQLDWAGKAETQYQVIVRGFDYFNTISEKVESGDQNKIAIKIVDDRGIESLRVVGVGVDINKHNHLASKG